MLAINAIPNIAKNLLTKSFAFIINIFRLERISKMAYNINIYERSSCVYEQIVPPAAVRLHGVSIPCSADCANPKAAALLHLNVISLFSLFLSINTTVWIAVDGARAPR